MSRSFTATALRLAVLGLIAGLLLASPPVTPRVDARSDDGRPAAARVSGTGETLKQCSSDESLSFKTCLTMNYSIGTLKGHTVVNLANYKLKIRRIDPSQLLQVKRLHVRMGVHAFCYAQCGGLDSYYNYDVKNRNLTPPRVGHLYVYKPWWVGRWWAIGEEMYFVCANAKITVKRYQKTWTDQLPNVCQGSPSLPT